MIVFFVWLMVVLITTLVTFILPESFCSTARIKVERNQSDIAPIQGQPMSDLYDPYFIQTEFEVIQSEIILGKVIENLGLNKEWGRKYAGGETLKTTETMKILTRRIELRPVRNTSLIEIRVFSEKPEEAAQIANEIARAYQAHRLEERQRLMTGGIKVLEEAYQANNEKIRSIRAQIAELSREQSSQNTNRLDEAKSSLDDLQRFGKVLFTKLAAERTDLSLPATSMVQIVDTAKPGLRPVRPNKPLNIAVGIIAGGVGGFFLATLIYVLQRREFRRKSGIPRTPFPPRFRAMVHILIALTVGFVVGYHCAVPLRLSTIIVVPLFLLVGGIASAYIELAKPRPTTSSNPG